jgi:D-serine deaminase-like pyridoxal phosphate-dependent protein
VIYHEKWNAIPLDLNEIGAEIGEVAKHITNVLGVNLHPHCKTHKSPIIVMTAVDDPRNVAAISAAAESEGVMPGIRKL